MTEVKEFICDRCLHDAKTKGNLITHLKKRSPCETTHSKITREDYIRKLTEKPVTENTVVCPNCNKSIHKAGLSRHNKTCRGSKTNNECTISNEIKELKKQMQAMQSEHKKEIENLKKQIGSAPQNVILNTTNNTTNTNIMINVNNFGDENTSYLTDEFLSYCLLNPRKGLTSLIENIHYNQEYPENHNLRCKSFKQNIFEKSINSEWRECDASNTLDELIRKGYRILNTHYTDNYMNDPDICDDEIKQRAYERFRFLGDTTCQDYFAVKRDVRLLVKDRTMYLLASPENDA